MTTTTETRQMTGTDPHQEVTMTFPIFCPCCGQQVEALDKGFAATSVEVAACDTQRAIGIVSWTIRKSAAYAAAVPVYSVRHSTGLVEFA
jgi:NAD-dependent DNA ligase